MPERKHSFLKEVFPYTGLLLVIFPNVPKVTRLQKLRCIFKFSKLNPKLQGFRSYEGYAELLLTIFPNDPKVTVLFQKIQKLQGFRSYKVTNVTILLKNFWKKILSQLQSYEVTRLRPKLPSNPSTYLATTVCIR